MIRNIFFFLLTIGSLGWIAYAGMNLVNFSEKSDPGKLFGIDDGRIFILNRPQEIQIEGTDFILQPRLIELFGILSSTQRKDERIFVSEKKAHILLQTNNLLSEDEIMSRFNNLGMESVGSKSYKWKNFKISFFKGVVDCQIDSERNKFNTVPWNTFDKKSSCSIIEFNEKKAIIKDFFQKDGITTIYTRRPQFIETQQSIDDEELYAGCIPSTLISYEFNEKILLSKKDAEFTKSPSLDWTNHGVVAFEYNNANFLLFDVKDGYDAEQILDIYLDSNNSGHNHFTGIQLTQNFPHNKARGFYSKKIDNFILFSDVNSALNEAEIAIELGQTLARYRKKKTSIFSNTPKMVIERSWSKDQKSAVSAYQKTLIGLEIKSTQKILQELPTEFEVKNYAMKSPVVDFIAHEKKDLVFALSKDNTLSGFADGKNFLNLKIAEGIVGSLFWSTAIENTAIFTSSSELCLINENGNAVKGFPVTIPGGISKGAAAFSWRGKENYLVASMDGNYHWVNHEGRVIKSGKNNITSLSFLPVVWISAKRLFFGFRNDTDFSMIEAENGKQLRTFPISKNAISICLENEIKFYDLEITSLVEFDQKGVKKMVTDLNRPIWIKAISEHNNEGFCIKNNNVISYYDKQGKFKMKVKIPFESVDYIYFQNTIKKGLLLGVLDGLTNKIHLYQMNGSEINLSKNQAQKKFSLSNQNNKLCIYTIIDKFIIQYVL